MKPKVIVKIRGGVCFDVQSDLPVDVMIIDYDNDDPDMNVTLPDGDEAIPMIPEVEVDEKNVRNLFNMLKREIES